MACRTCIINTWLHIYTTLYIMNADKIEKLINRKVNKTECFAKKIGKGFRENDIHKFRVSVKMLRSFLRLIAWHSGNHKVKIPGKLRRLYLLAGEIRELQLELAFFGGKHINVPEYLLELNNTMQHTKNEWKRIYTKKFFHKIASKLSGLHSEKVPKSAIGDWVKENAGKIEKLSHAILISDIGLHDIRKMLKGIIYITRLGEKHCGVKGGEGIGIPVKYLEQIEQQAGDYYNRAVTLRNLLAYFSTNKKVKNNVISYCNEERKLLQQQKVEIMASLRKIVRNML